MSTLTNNNRYSLYVNKNIELVETIVVKFDDVASAMNQIVINKTGYDSVNFSDRTTWKYYQNISGNYHLSDNLIKIKSLDLDEEILFSKEKLKDHKITKQAYRYGSRYYNELISLYPDQEMLILGILYPVDINTAIEAKDGTILTYPADLIESNEYTLKDRLQQWSYDYVFRWINKQYTLSDDLYLATYIAQYYLHMLQALMSIRLENCKTNEVHSYHIQQYLSSHGFLDSYLDILTLEQSLFFYRNIEYIEHNSGKRDTFDWLVDNTMTKRDLPLYQLTMKHNTQNIGVR